MAVIGFLLGVDLSKIQLDNVDCTKPFEQMERLEWIKLQKSNLENIPPGLGKLHNLKQLEMSQNKLESVDGSWYEELRSLRYLNLRKNRLINSSVPENLFTNSSLQTVDMSYNELTEVPAGLLNSTSLITLNLSNNQISNVPKELFMNCVSLIVLNLSNNKIDSFPTNLRRMPNLKSINLSHNKLSLAQLRSVAGLKKLQTLLLSETSRRIENFPPDLDKLQFLTELDISKNNLTKLPDTVFGIKSLQRLNFSENQIEDIHPPEEGATCWPPLELLNVSHNKLSTLPSFITRLSRLRRLYIDGNKLTFGGIPGGIGKLEKLQVLSASDNLLENIPEGLSRCGELRHLNLRGNRLVTLPDAIHVMMETLTEFLVDQNPNLKMPPKLDENLSNIGKGGGRGRRANKEPYVYNIDFSLETQMRLARGGQAAAAAAQESASATANTAGHKESTASRIRRLRKKRAHLEESLDEESNAVLEGMRKIAADKNNRERPMNSEELIIPDDDNQGGKKWQKTLEKPNWNYSQIFEDGAGEGAGLEQWDIHNFRPRKLQDFSQLGTFYRGDCYLVLETCRDSAKSSLTHNVHYWIGCNASLDKVTCAAMHAVNLRNYMETETRSRRQQDREEDPEFLEMWTRNFVEFRVLDGCQAESGFMAGEEELIHRKRLYRVFSEGDRVKLYNCPITPASLSSNHVYLFDQSSSKIYVWMGVNTSLVNKRKGRLMAESLIDKQKRHKEGGDIRMLVQKQGEESDEFKRALLYAALVENDNSRFDFHYDHDEMEDAVDFEDPAAYSPSRWPEVLPADMGWIRSNWRPEEPIVIQVILAPGTLELKQAILPLKPNSTTNRRQLNKSLVEDKKEQAFIIQSCGLVFVWTGEKAENFLKNAAFKLALEMLENNLLVCSSHRPLMVMQNSEMHLFKMQFVDWEDEKVHVDFTRSMASILQNGTNVSDLTSKAMKVDLRSFFMPREKETSWKEAEAMMEECNEDLVMSADHVDEPELVGKAKYMKYLKQHVFQKNHWVPVDERWRGHFFSRNCFVVNVDYWEFMEEEVDEDDEDEENPKEEVAHRIQTVVYFWQGREASNIPWLTFNMTLLREMHVEQGRSRNVEVKMMHQQQELPQFLAHFMHEFTIHSGSYSDILKGLKTNRVQMYYLRDNGNPLYTRTIEVLPAITFLNSHYHYLVKVPAKLLGSTRDQVMCWVGEFSCEKYNDVLLRVANSIFVDPAKHTEENMPEIRVIKEGEEPELFWKCLVGRNRNYDRDAPFKEHSRLFRLSNDAGYFSASEKCADFCQDDLADDDAMLLDSGKEIFIWQGKNSSEVEQNLSLHAGRLYHEHMTRLQPNAPRKQVLIVKHKETHGFRRCFHGWGPFKEPKEWSG